MTIRSRTAVLALAIVGSVGFMRGDEVLAVAHQAPSVAAVTTAVTRRVTIRHNSTVLATLEIPAGISFSLSTVVRAQTTPSRLETTAAARDSAPPRELSTTVGVTRRHYLVLSTDDRSAAFTLEAGNDTTLTVEP